MDRLVNAKIPTFIVNGYLILHAFVLWLQGFIYFSLGVFIHTVLRRAFIDDSGLAEIGTFVYFLCCTGIALIGVSFLTNYVLLNQSIGSYGWLAMVLGLLFIFQVLFCMAGFYYIDKLKNTLRLAISTIMANYNAGSYLNVMLNTLQTMLRCCGSTSYASWFLTGWAEGKPRVPQSCCRDVIRCHNLEPLILEDINKIGCNVRIDFVAAHSEAGILGLLLAAILTEFLAVSASVLMSLRYRKLREINSVLPLIDPNEGPR